MFLNDEFTYSGREWNDGTKWLVTLAESIKYTNELKKLNGKKNQLKIRVQLISIF